MRLGPATIGQASTRPGSTRQASTARIAEALAALVRESTGNNLPLAAMSVFVLTALVGSAVELGRAYHAPNRLQSARNAGVLAGRRAELTNSYDTNAQTYFKAKFDQSRQGTRTSPFDTETNVDFSNHTAMVR